MTAIPAQWSSLEPIALPHLWATSSSCRRHRRSEKVAQPDQVVGDHVQAKHCTHLFGAAQLELTQPTPLFDPAEHLLDAAAGVDRLGVALVAGGAAINGGTTRAGGVLGHMRCDADAAHLSDIPLGVVVLVGADRFLVGTGTIRRHHLGGIPLSGARRLCDAAVDDQGMAVVHEHVAPVAG
jgi:hypothetical protein